MPSRCRCSPALRGDSTIELGLTLDNGFHPMLVGGNPTRPVTRFPGGIDSWRSKNYYVWPNVLDQRGQTCVMKSQIREVSVILDGGRGSWPQTYDNWDVATVKIIDAGEVVWTSQSAITRLTQAQPRAWIPGRSTP